MELKGSNYSGGYIFSITQTAMDSMLKAGWMPTALRFHGGEASCCNAFMLRVL
jgi:hypothetical protein